ncbi:MAG: phosphoribosylglycinamide synthetase C domain-containing protein, partial [Acidimicrobiia bacterium]
GDGPQVLEFNCRLGDPEAQVVLPRLEDDLAELLVAGLEGRLADRELRWSPRTAVDVVLASAGYPESPRTGEPIAGLEEAAHLPDVLVFHAGTARRNGRVVTAGGRVLNVVGLGDTLEAARDRAYQAVDRVSWPGRQHRRDIATMSRELSVRAPGQGLRTGMEG